MRKWMGLVLTACLLLTGCGGGTAEEAPPEAEQPAEVPETPAESEEPETPEEVTRDNWRVAYGAFLEEKSAEAVWIRNPDNPDYDPNWVDAEAAEVTGSYVLYDIDKDGVPELLMRYGLGEAGAHTTVYGYADGAVTELGDIPSGHSSFYAWPGENAIARNWGHMGGHFVEKISLVDGDLQVETVFEEGYAAGGEEAAEYTDMADIVPGSSYLWETRPMVTLPQPHALTLPIYDYGKERTAKPMDSGRDAAAKAAIEAVLNGEAEFYGVTADGFGGDTGWTNLEDYLAPNGVTEYNDLPMEVTAQEWRDFNGDGQSEALVTIRSAAGDSYEDMKQVVFSWQDGMVYAYCMNYMGYYEPEDTVFVPKYDGAALTLAFDGYQAYLYAPGQELP